MSKFEKKFGKYAIPNLTLVLIMCYVAGYIIQLMGAAGGTNLLGFLTLTDLETGDLGDRAP